MRKREFVQILIYGRGSRTFFDGSRKLSVTCAETGAAGGDSRPLSPVFMYREIISRVIVPVIGSNPSAFAAIIGADISGNEKNGTTATTETRICIARKT